METKDVIINLQTGFNDLDKLMGGFRGGELIFLGARPGVGKSAFMETVVNYVSVASEKTVALFSLELTEREQNLRLLSNLSQIQLSHIKSRDLDNVDVLRLADAAKKRSSAKVLIDDSSAMTVKQIRQKCLDIKAKELTLDLVVIDYLQLIHTDQKDAAHRDEQVEFIVNSLKALAVDLNVPVVVLSQLSRIIEDRENKRPIFSDISNAKQATLSKFDAVFFLYRESYYRSPIDGEEQVAELIVAQQKRGFLGTVKLKWEGKFFSFYNL